MNKLTNMDDEGSGISVSYQDDQHIIDERKCNFALSGHSFLPSYDLNDPNTVQRIHTKGKYLFLGNRKFWVKGTTYGTFRPDENGSEYGNPQIVRRDFTAMALNGFNAIRTYTVPPRWLLDEAQIHGLKVMIGLPWEQHLAFFEYGALAHDIVERLRQGVRSCAGHPAVLCYAIGNEIPSSIVRWYGHQRVERFLMRLYKAAKAEDHNGLVTYVNYPTTEYLDLPFMDLVSYNVYLESQEKLAAYLPRLQNLAGDRPLLIAEIGLDSLRNGPETQAAVLDWQIRSVFASGCAGGFIFAWTDEWYRGGHDILDWDFGLTTRDRQPKPALFTVRRAFDEIPFGPEQPWPRVSVIVCSYNGARTIRDTLEALQLLDYPDFEVIVVDDGSRDATSDIAAEYPVRLIRTENRGLAVARNTGLNAANGDIVAFIDDDAYPDVHWLRHLAATLVRSNHAGVGGPNIPPAGDGLVADCVANAPGRPIHVLLTDEVAEHIPGCNMAFWKDRLQSIGGFDPRFHAAGDDVDVCWRLQDQGWTLGFSPGALVWHHHRDSIARYWKQQIGYGKAEALLEKKWPGKYNHFGHVAWAGRLYGNGITEAFLARRWRIYHGTWGSAPFQSLYQPNPDTLSSLPLMPEWFLIIALLIGLSAIGMVWTPFLITVPLLAAATAAPIIQAARSAAKASFQTRPLTAKTRTKLRVATAFLHLLQPMARLIGRIRHGLTPWRRYGQPLGTFPGWRSIAIWEETWKSATDRLTDLEARICRLGASVRRGGDYDLWDLEIRFGALGCARLLLTVEEHGAGKQMVRLRVWPIPHKAWVGLTLLSLVLSIVAISEQVWSAAGIFAIVSLLLAVRQYQDCATAAGCWVKALAKQPNLKGS